MRGFKDKLGVGETWHSVFTAAKCKMKAQDFADFVEANNQVTS